MDHIAVQGCSVKQVCPVEAHGIALPVLRSGGCGTLGTMVAKQVGRGVRRLSVVGTQRNSDGDTSTPAAQSSPRPKPTKAERDAQLAAARVKSAEAMARKAQVRAEARAAGVIPNLERFRNGDYPVSEWTDEEIARGRPANLDGGFAGHHPSFTGRQIQQIKGELLRRGQRQFDSLYPMAIKALADVAMHGESEAARVKAAMALAERVAGKVPEKIEIKSSDPWQDILDDIMDDEVLQRMTTEDAG